MTSRGGDQAVGGSVHLGVELASLRQQVDLCLKICRRSLVGDQQSSDRPQPQLKEMCDTLGEHHRVLVAQQSRVEHLSELCRMHTMAIARSWQWVAALVQASSTLNMSTLPPHGGANLDEMVGKNSSPSAIQRRGSSEHVGGSPEREAGNVFQDESGQSVAAAEGVTTLLLENLLEPPIVRTAESAEGVPSRGKNEETDGKASVMSVSQSSDEGILNTQDIDQLEASLWQMAHDAEGSKRQEEVQGVSATDLGSEGDDGKIAPVEKDAPNSSSADGEGGAGENEVQDEAGIGDSVIVDLLEE
eukprot:6465417-Amphidinium_carterae.1